ncbi:MAG: hypothetical protein J6K32_12875 [Clostridia bacterium]|nr:hypothetical protein [Clostridia bacterium]
MEENGMKIAVEACGVIGIRNAYEIDLEVNGEGVITMLEEAVARAADNGIRPKRGRNEEFAGRIRIELEFLGDMEQEAK